MKQQSRDKNRQIDIPVNVISHERQRYAVWYGGSYFGASEQFQQVAYTKKQYDEYGPSICRNNAMFGAF
jgi:actin-related protein 3